MPQPRRLARKPLPDFFIGAHAAAAGIPLLTRDPQRVRTYFPDVMLIAPQDTWHASGQVSNQLAHLTLIARAGRSASA